MFVTRKSKNPRCFEGVHVSVLYEANKKAWITQKLFENYIREVDRQFECQECKVLMLVDKCTAQGHVKDLKAMQLEFLPPNTRSLLQSMDQGIIWFLKQLCQ